MRFSPLSFILGAVAASLIPVASRVFRPLAVEATAAGMGLFEDARRIVAEQVEALEDIMAEARSRREHLDEAAAAVALEQVAEAATEEPAAAPRARRRSTNGSAVRRRP
jgi:hypothetical protein